MLSARLLSGRGKNGRRRRAADLQGRQAAVSPDPVVDMNDQIPLVQRGHVGNELIAAFFTFDGTNQTIAQNVGFRNDRNIADSKSLIQRQNGERRSVPCFQRLIPSVDLGHNGGAFL